MPGGDRAAREPWRMAAAVLFDLKREDEIVRRFHAQSGAETVVGMLQRQLNCVSTTSMGRCFDAAAGLLGVSEIQGYEGQAAMLLEGLAERHGRVEPLANGYMITTEGVLDIYSLFAALADCDDIPYGAALFHATLAEGLSAWVRRAAAKKGISHVALGGGCFLNNILSQTLNDSLSAHGVIVLAAQQLPPNDGAISFGQASVALQQINQGI
jgi:hydrogenase maturation protein HypF